ncbi:MAG: hypothetical protein IH624_18950 [Phycisphaerae bacterium]|nr:hypothetical protein [Phycisphaerae bacterium]
MKNADTTRALPLGFAKAAGRLAAAAVLYMVLLWYFFQPTPSGLPRAQYLIGFNWIVGAMGCFVLSRRWIAAFAGSFFAGAVYGFGPFALGFAAYHASAGAPLAMVPWLFCPAAFWRKWWPATSQRLARISRLTPGIVTAVLCALPFAGIITFFWLTSRPWFGPVFPLPVGLRLDAAHLEGLVLPLTMRPHDFIFSFYHVPVAALVMGLCIYFASGRMGAMIVVVGAIALAFAGPVAQVSPVVWAVIPMLFGAIVIGLGMEGLAWAGPSDGRWLLFCAAATAIITAGCTYLGFTEGAIYHRTALLHAGGLLSVGVIYALTRAHLRLHPLRWMLLSAALALDILTSGKQIADMLL